MTSTRKSVPCLRSFLFHLLLVAALCAHAAIASGDTAAAAARPKIGLVLGGGGAKGAAHIGVLKVLEERKIPIDYIAGTSMGAIVGALYASGLPAAELEGVLTGIDWKDVFSGDPDRRDIDYRRKREDYDILTGLALGVKDGRIVMPRGLIKDQKVNVLFETLLLHTSDIEDFDRLPIPFRAVAADLETGEMVVLRSGRLADAARASMSVAGVFSPVELDGRLLTDGGIVRNLPVDIVRSMGAEVIICIDVDKQLAKKDELSSSFSILNQMVDIMMKRNVKEQIATLGPQDVYINPRLGPLGSIDFERTAEIARIGEAAAREAVGSLDRYSVTDAEYAAFLASHRREQVRDIPVSSVRIAVEGETQISPQIVASRLSVRPGDTVDAGKLKDEAGVIYGTGDFERVDIYVQRQKEGYALEVKAKEKSWGPNYLRMGVALQSDFEGGNSYNVLLDYTRRWVNRLGAEWKTRINLGSPAGIYSEFYQPLSVQRLFFISPHAEWRSEPYDIFWGRKKIASYLIRSYEAGIDFGIQPWMYGEGRIGLRYGTFNGWPRIGEIDLPKESVTRGAVVAGGRLDQLDNVNFPRKGYLAQVGFLSSLKALGSEDEYSRLSGSVIGAYTFGRQTVLASLAAGTRIGKPLPFYDQFELGGFLNLSGMRTHQILGQSMALARLITYNRVGRSFIGDLYIGGSIESGNVWDEGSKQFDLSRLRLAGSVFIGYDTIIGPLYIAYGHTDGGYRAGYFYLGRSF